jgi:hypothetical protein
MNTVMKRALYLVALACALARPVWAQTPVQVYPADLSVPFGSVTGTLVLIEDTLAFIDDSQPDASFAIRRDDMVDFTHTGDTLSISTRSPIVYRSNELPRVRLRVGLAEELVAWHARPQTATTRPGSAPALAPGGPVATYEVQHDHRLGTCQGRLIINETDFGFESVTDVNHSRRWEYADIKEIEQDGIYKLTVTPFVGNQYNLEFIGKGLDRRTYNQVVDRVTAVRAR